MTGTGPLSSLGAEGPTLLVAAPIVVHQGTTATVVVRFRPAGYPRIDDGGAVGPHPRAEQWTVRGPELHRRPARDVHLVNLAGRTGTHVTRGTGAPVRTARTQELEVTGPRTGRGLRARRSGCPSR